MTRGGRRRTSGAAKCLSCGALLTGPAAPFGQFCDDACAIFARRYGGGYQDPKGPRGLVRQWGKARSEYRR